MQESTNNNVNSSKRDELVDSLAKCSVCKKEAVAANSTLCDQCQKLLLYGLSAKPELLVYGLGGAEVHPRIRFGARLLDNSIYVLLHIVLIPTALVQYLEFAPILKFGFFMGISILCEAFLLSTVGSTLGKIWFGIQVKNSDGSLLTFNQATTRALKVWYRGLGLCIPGVSSITQLVAYRNLQANRITSWDKDGSFVVNHEPLSLLRLIFGVLLVIFCRAIMFYIDFNS